MTIKDILNYEVIKSSKSNKALFDRFLKRGKILLIDTFANEHGELFVVYKWDFDGEQKYSVTGDEIDWELGYLYERTMKCVINSLLLSEIEYEELEKVISKHEKDNNNS